MLKLGSLGQGFGCPARFIDSLLGAAGGTGMIWRATPSGYQHPWEDARRISTPTSLTRSGAMLAQEPTSDADAIDGEGQGSCRRTLPGRRLRIVRSRRSAAGCRTRQRLLGERSNDLCDDHHHHDGDRDDGDRPCASLLGALSRNRICSPSVGEDQGPTERRVAPRKARRRAAHRPRGLPFRGPDGRVKGPRPRPLGGPSGLMGHSLRTTATGASSGRDVTAVRTWT